MQPNLCSAATVLHRLCISLITLHEHLLVTTQCDLMEGKSKSDLYKSSPPNSTPVTKPTPAPKCPGRLLALYSNPAFREIVSQDEGKKCVVIFPSPFCPHLSSQCLQEVTLLWFEWPHTLGELLWPLQPPTPATKYSSKQISFNVHCKPEDEGFHFTSCCCSFLHNLAKMQ